MNARQRRLRRRYTAPAVLCLIDAVEQAADLMQETGQTMTVEECRGMANGLREMMRMNPEWQAIAKGRPTPTDSGEGT